VSFYTFIYIFFVLEQHCLYVTTRIECAYSRTCVSIEQLGTNVVKQKVNSA